ncbi:MAG: immunoglobulin domain-containing protein, partial [Bacteroidota bacterium]
NGSIPPEIGDFSSLDTLLLGDESLNGSIPPEIGNLTSLKFLGIVESSINGNIPSEIGNLTNLKLLALENNHLEGTIPEVINNLTNLQNLYLRENQFTDLPDLSSISPLGELYICDNRFTFEDIEPNIDVAEKFDYSPQAKVGEEKNYQVEEGTSKTLSVDVGGDNNTYQWFFDGDTIQGATQSSYEVTDFQFEDEGVYTCKINNTVATDLTLTSKDKNLTGIYDGYTVTFDVKDEQDNTIDDAIVILDNTEYEPGLYEIKDVESGTHSYKVKKDGYVSVEDDIEITDQDTTLDVTLEETTVRFEVMDENGDPFNEATVTFDDEQHEPGMYEFQGIKAGTYPYKVEHYKYFTVEDEVQVTDQDVTVQVNLDKKGPPYVPDIQPAGDTVHGYVKFVIKMDDPGNVSYSINSGDTTAMRQADNAFFSDVRYPEEGNCQVDFLLEDSLGNTKTKSVEFEMMPRDATIPLGLPDNRLIIDSFKRPNNGVSNDLDYYGSGDYNGDGKVDSSDSNEIGNLGSVEVPNPGWKCAVAEGNEEGVKCADVCDGSASECLVLDGERNKSLERADVNGDGVVNETDRDMIREYYFNDDSLWPEGDVTDHLPSHWYRLNRTEKIDWIENTVAEMTRADDYLYTLFDEGFLDHYPDCSNFERQTLINLRGYSDLKDMPEEEFQEEGNYPFSLDYHARFNLPVNGVSTETTDGIPHGINSIYIGPESGKPEDASVTNFSNWYYFEPQRDHTRVKPGDWSMDETGYASQRYPWEDYFYEEGDPASTYPYVRWDIEDGEASLNEWDCLIAQRIPQRLDNNAPSINLSEDLEGQVVDFNEVNLDYNIEDGEFLYNNDFSGYQDWVNTNVYDESFLDRCYYNFNGKKENIDCYGHNSEEIGHSVYNDSGSVNLKQTEGENRLLITAKDIAGNVEHDTLQWLVDSYKPEIMVSGIAQGEFTNADSLEVDIEVKDAYLTDARFSHKDDTLSVMPGDTSIFVFPGEGEDSIAVTARDTAANTSDTLVAFICDRTPPQLDVQYPDDTFANRKEVVATLEDQYPDTKGYSINEGDTTFFTSDTARLSLDDGQYEILLTGRDSAGNISDTLLTTIFDTQKPELIISGMQERFYKETLTGTIEAADNYLKDYGYKIDNGEFTSLIDSGSTSSLELNLQEGEHVIEFQARDSAGNSTDTSLTKMFDTTEPEITIQSPNSDEEFSSS